MINDQVQKQEGGDSSTNVQGHAIVIHQGISYSDAKEIALDVYKANFLQLSRDAVEVARARAEEITDAFLEKLKQENEAAVSELKKPGMQAALFDAQKQYAKTGDKNLEGLLVDILVERASTPERNIHQIVLDESLAVAAKLTTEQMDALTINFLLSKTKKLNLLNLDAVSRYFDTDILPFLAELTETSSCYEHLEYVGCGSLIHLGGIHSIEHLFRIQYPGLFSKGFDQSRFETDIAPVSDYPDLLMACFHDTAKLQINSLDIDVLKQKLEQRNSSADLINKFTGLFNSSLMSDQEIKEYLLKAKPEAKKLFDLWEKSSISKFTLTTVGIAIAQANFRRRTGTKLNLSIWIK
jgi:hypothetical protein